jgi:hypothetical protein
MSYGMFKGSGKASGAMKDYLDKKAKKLEKEKEKQKPEYKNNPAFGDPSHHSNRKTRTEAKVDKPMIFGKDAARNERRFGTKGKFDPEGSGPRGQDISQRAKLAVQRKKEHEARRGVKTKGMKEGFSDWRIDLSEYTGMMPQKSSEEDRKVTEKKVKNKITVNPLQGQAESFALCDMS